MSYQKTHSIIFKDIDGVTCEVGIYDDVDTTPTVATFTGATNAFEVSSGESDDFFAPIRSKTGYVRMYGSLSDFSSVMATGSRDKRVVFSRGGSVQFMGWLKPETFKTSWDIEPNLFELPVASGLGVLESVNAEPDETKTVTIYHGNTTTTFSVGYGMTPVWRLLLECIAGTGIPYTNIIFPDEVADGTCGLLNTVSRYNFLKENSADNYDDADYYPIEGDTIKDMLSGICSFFGWTAVEQGADLYFVSHTASAYKQITLLKLVDWLSSVNTADLTAATAPSISALSAVTELDGNGNTMEVLQGNKKITLECDINPIGEVIPELDDKDLDLYKSYVPSQAALENWAGDKVFSYKVYKVKDGCKTAEVHRYIDNGSGFVEWDYERDPDQFDVGQGPACAIVDYDCCTKSEADGSKRNWNYRKGIFITMEGYDYDRWVVDHSYHWMNDGVFIDGTVAGRSLPLLVLTSRASASYDNGCFCIGGSSSGMSYVDSHLDNLYNNDWNIPWGGETRNYAIPAFKNGKCCLKVILRVGDKYFNGTSWQSSLDDFAFYIGSSDDYQSSKGDTGKVWNTKYLHQPYNGADGFVIPITEHLEGKVQLIIPGDCLPGLNDIVHSTVDTDEHPPHSGYTFGVFATLALYGLKIDYVADTSTVVGDGDKKTNRYQTIANKDFVEDREVSLKIASDNNNAAGYAILHDAAGNAVSQITYTDGAERPEERLLASMKSHYGKVQRKLTLKVRMGNVLPYDTITYGGVVYAVTGVKHNYRDANTELTLIEI